MRLALVVPALGPVLLALVVLLVLEQVQVQLVVVSYVIRVLAPA